MRKLTYKMVMAELKVQLKRQRVSYARLAHNLDVPESTLKKWFNAESGSFDRLSLICEALGIPLETVLKSLSEQSILTFTMSKEQQALFVKNREAFNLFWFLVYERKTLTEAQTLLRLEMRELRVLLLKLDKVGLIEVGVDDKVKIPKMKPIRWEFRGPFMEELKQEWSSRLAKDAEAKGDSSRFVLQFFQLSKNSAEELFKDLQALEEKYARRTIMELSYEKKKLTQIRYQALTAGESFITT